MRRCPLPSQTYPSLRTVANEALHATAAPKRPPARSGGPENEVEASVARRLRTTPEGANPQDLIPSTITALRGEGHRSIVVVGNYKVDPITAVSCRAKDRPFGPPSNLFRPRRSAPPSRAWVEAPGTAPGSERLIPTPIYRHSGPCDPQREYRGRGARWEEAARESSSGLSVEAGRIAPRGQNLHHLVGLATIPVDLPALCRICEWIAIRRSGVSSVGAFGIERGAGSPVDAEPGQAARVQSRGENGWRFRQAGALPR